MDELLKSILTVVALVVLTVVSSWMKKRSEGGAGESWGDETGPRLPLPPVKPRQTPSGPSAPEGSRPGAPTNWEEELRRLLQGEPAPPPPPPPLVVRETRPEPPLAPQVPVPSLPSRRVEPVVPVAIEAEGEGGEGLNVAMAESRVAYERAARLQEAAGQRMQQAAQAAALPSWGMQPAPAAAPEIQGLIRDLRSGTQVRRAFVAALIFGPPKALEH